MDRRPEHRFISRRTLGRWGVRSKALAGQKGQALTEFALVVPMIVMIILFSVWFLELVQVKLKVQEAARYVAWEATAYPMHDYKKGTVAGFSKAQSAIMAEAKTRYADLDSATTKATPKRIFSAGFSLPMIFLSQAPEKDVPGGSVANMIAGIAKVVAALVYAVAYSSDNPTATLLIASRGKAMAGTGSSVFGQSSWGFNRNGYVTSMVSTLLVNLWANRGMVGVTGEKVLKDDVMYHLLTEQYKLLVDDWALSEGDDVHQSGAHPGVSKGSAYWKQVDRMYLMTKKGKTVLRTRATELVTKMRVALGAQLAIPMNFNEFDDIVKTAVVSKNYGPKQAQKTSSGKAKVQQDRGTTKSYDTSPTCYGYCPGGDNLKNYGKTLKERGEHFMGCKGEMKLGCTSTLSQDNPFGDYLDR